MVSPMMSQISAACNQCTNASANSAHGKTSTRQPEFI